MPRTGKKKRVLKMPQNSHFISRGTETEYGINMKVEEYECIRLIDYMAYTQEECARQMEVSRATVQMLYAEARKKLARFLVEGISLQIEGGDYELSHRASVKEKTSDCSLNGLAACHSETPGMGKERRHMKIAVTYENGQVFQHFGHTEQFKVYDVEAGKITGSQVVDTNGQGHGALAGFLANGDIDVLICGGIGGGARNALAEAGIKLFPGAQGDADAQVESYLAGTLNYDSDTMCTHHDHSHGDCGGHGHGKCGHHCE